MKKYIFNATYASETNLDLKDELGQTEVYFLDNLGVGGNYKDLTILTDYAVKEAKKLGLRIIKLEYTKKEFIDQVFDWDEMNIDNLLNDDSDFVVKTIN